MKKIILHFLITGVAIILTAYFIPGIMLKNSLDGLLLVVVAFTIVNTFIKPLLKILSLPIELATLGLFTLIINTALLLLIDYLLIPLKIEGFWFPGFVYGPMVIAPMYVAAFISALIGSVIISLVSSVLNWLTN